MAKHSLSAKGLSLSQAQSISNMCNQRVREINNKLSVVNNASKTLEIGDKTYIETPANPLPGNVIELLKEKSRLSATQAFLMENMREKDNLIRLTKFKTFDYELTEPQPKRSAFVLVEMDESVEESWGWDQLTTAEYNEYLEAEAYASHIGQFIHKGGELDKLRKDLPNLKTLEWMEVETGKKTPMMVTPHHTQDQLLELHESLAALHRDYEQRVNYFKAKVKNLVTAENARIAKENGQKQAVMNRANQEILAEYEKLQKAWFDAEKAARFEFEESVQKTIAEISALRIQVPERFQPVIDMFITKE
jgi:hypothetical protein